MLRTVPPLAMPRGLASRQGRFVPGEAEGPDPPAREFVEERGLPVRAEATPVPNLDPPSRTYALRRLLLSLAVAAMGVIDLFSALLSHPPERLVAL